MSIIDAQNNNASCHCLCHKSVRQEFYYPNRPCCACRSAFFVDNNNNIDLSERISNLDHKIEHAYIEIEKCFERIERLEEHKNRQIDENRKASRRMDELEKKIESESIMRKDLRDYCFERLGSALNPSSLPINIYERIEKLESDHLDKLSPYAYVTLNTKIKLLEEHVKGMTEAYLRKVIQNAIPHKCPVCEGAAYLRQTEERCGGICKSCEGKGIIIPS